MSTSNFTPSVLTITSAVPTGTGQGELNVVTNPSASTDLSNWTASPSSGFASRQTSGSPLDPVVATGFQLSSSGVGQTLTSASLTVPTSLRNRKLKLEFYMTQATAAFKVDVLNSSGVRFALTTDASGVSNLPALSTSGKYTTYFDMDSGATVQVRFTSILATGTLSFTQVIVGPGIQPQGAVVGEWTSFIPAITDSTGANVKSASPTNNSARWRRVGSQMEVVIIYRHSTTVGTNGTGTYRFQLPTGFTVDTSALPPGTPNHRAMVGTGQANSAGGAGDAQLLEVWTETASTTNYVSAYTYPVGTLTGFTIDGTSFGFGSTFREISLDFAVPIAEWAGSGTVQLAQNDVEYAWSTDGTTTAGNTQSDNGLYGYGPGGTSFVSIDSNTANNQTKKRVRFQTPIQPGDVFTVEVNRGDNLWLPVPNSNGPSSAIYEGTGRYGVGYERVSGSSTDIYVAFGNGGGSAYKGTAKTYGELNTDPWSGYTSAKWRVRKSSAGAAVGFGIVSPGVSAGLVSASGLPGNTTGNAIAAGYVGETVSASPGSAVTPGVSVASGINKTVTSISLSPGIWDVQGLVQFATGATLAGMTIMYSGISLNDNSNDISNNLAVTGLATNNTVSANFFLPCGPRRLTVTTTTTVYLVAGFNYSTLGGTTYGTASTIRATRIA